MKKIEEIIKKYNPLLYRKLVKSNLKREEINTLFETKVGLYLPTDAIDLFQIFNGTEVKFNLIDKKYKEIDSDCIFFPNGYLMSIYESIQIFETNRDIFNIDGNIHFPIFGTGHEIYHTVILNEYPNQNSKVDGVFEIIKGSIPSKVYDTFELFIETTVAAYEKGIYYLNENNLFSCKAFEEFELKGILNPNSRGF